MSEENIIYFSPQETQEEGDSIEPIKTDFKEYNNLNDYYIKVIYEEDNLSIIIYNIDLLDGIRYEFNNNVKDLFKLSNVFKKLGKIEKIFKAIIDLIDENNYTVIKKDDKLLFTLKIEESQNKDKEISFMLSKKLKDNKNDFIKIISELLKKLRISYNTIVKEKEAKKINEKESMHFSINSINTTNNSFNSGNMINQINNFIEMPKPERTKLFHLNCSSCYLIPEININNSDFPFIQIKCEKNHIEKKIDLIKFIEKSNKFSKEKYECECDEFKQNSNLELYYCHNCNKIICEKCSSKHDSNHRIIFEELMEHYCIDHQMEFFAYCSKCKQNICKLCKKHKNHEIEEFVNIIPSKEELNNIIKKKDDIVSKIENIELLLDSYKNEMTQKIDEIKQYYDIEKNILESIINQYSKNLFNYQIIKNLQNIEKCNLNEQSINSKDSFSEKTKKLLKIFDTIENKSIDSKAIKLIKNINTKETVYSLCYLKKSNLIAMGLKKKIDLMDLKFNIISSNNLLDDKIAYISELKDGKIVSVDLNKYIKILEVKNEKLEIYKKIESKEERNFVGIELSNKNIICGGNQYLSIIEPSYFFRYSLKQSVDLGTFITNIVELDENSFLVGLGNTHKILIYSSIDNQKISEINNIYLKGNNYSIAKLSDNIIGISGWEGEYMKEGCLYMFSIQKKIILKKIVMNDLKCCNIITKINNNEFATAGTGKYLDDHLDLVLLNCKHDSKELIINKINDYKRAYCIVIEAILSLNNYIIGSDSSSNLKIWTIE